MKRLAFLFFVGAAVVIAVFFMTTASGSDQQGVGYTGQLVHEDGSTFEQNSYDVQFSIYKQMTDGEPIWEDLVTVDVGVLGEFSVYLGPIEGEVFEVDASDPNDTGDRYLQIYYETAKAMDRVLIVASPYATSADVATTSKVTRDIAKKIWEPDDTLVDTLSKQMVSGSYASLGSQQIADLQARMNEIESAVERLTKEVESLRGKIE